MDSAKRVLAYALVASSLLALAGNGASAEPVKITIGWSVTPSDLAPLMLAPGVAKYNGVTYTAEPVHFRGTTVQITALQSGELDIASLGSNSFPIAVENAKMADLRIIADEVRDMPGWAGVEYRVLENSPIKAIDDLKGKVIAVNVYGGVSDISVQAMLRKRNMFARKDYTEIEVPLPDMSAVLFEHKADLVNSVHPFDLDPKFQAQTRVLFTTPDAVGPFELGMLAARTGFIAEHRAALIDLLQDYVSAIRWYEDPANRAKALDIISSVTKQPESIFESWLLVPGKDYYRDQNGMPDLDMVTANIHVEQELSLVKEDLDAKEYADLGPLKEAVARLK
ncbi:MAG TPA: ABC transporter substrate-binding protein [Stellaceae bacterium]|jgi:NitT/TauT family transport system substrate-binding protein|nr:ABC transporter substrate-binding protein [Stellaceae bacterium]